jgi:hypothetical protein
MIYIEISVVENYNIKELFKGCYNLHFNKDFYYNNKIKKDNKKNNKNSLFSSISDTDDVEIKLKKN